MKTISSAVEEYIKSKPFLISALSQGIINLTSLSRIIKSEIELSLKKEVRYGAIVMALKRLSSELEFRTTYKIVKIIKDIGDITVRSSLIDYNFKVSDTLLSNQVKLLAKVGNKDDFYTSSRGVNECNIVVSGNLSSLVETILKEEYCISKQTNLSSISIKLPAENISIPGVYYFVFQRLSWEGINIYEVISTSNEFTILVNEEQVDKAFRVVKNLKNL
ncbi:MAG TPA: aspartate kinase [Flavobacteriaceae bacterium]|jgi:aspartokinase|nr:aspartate kinase [Flavobacteriaceae bacterium]|tara:strand:- start:670 stop:1326 length:657 start_codon:yes stop_codon:yes gene_type:complete